MSSGNYRASSGKRNKVKCRVCLSEVLLQNYRVHLRHYPGKKPNDLRPACQSSIVSLFKRVEDQVGRKRARNDDETIESSCTDYLNDDLVDPHSEVAALALEGVASEVSEEQKTSCLETNIQCEATAIDVRPTPALLSQINEKLDNLSLIKLDEMRDDANLSQGHSGKENV